MGGGGPHPILVASSRCAVTTGFPTPASGIRDKSDGLLPYRYTIAIENSAHANYHTEKVLDALLAECLPFYWGCTNLERRPDRLASFHVHLSAMANDTFTARVARYGAIDGRELSLTPAIRHLFRDNDFGYRRSFVGCALRHLALWRELADSAAPGVLIFEDDVVPCLGFEGQLELWVATPRIVKTRLVPPGSGYDSDIQNDFESLTG